MGDEAFIPQERTPSECRVDRCRHIEKLIRAAHPIKATDLVRVTEIKPTVSYRVNVYRNPNDKALVRLNRMIWSSFVAVRKKGLHYDPVWPSKEPA
jgi:hypothetical protein